VLALSAKKARDSHGKANQFPISGTRAVCDTDDMEAEQPLLIDPAKEDPKPFFSWSRSGHFSVMIPAPVDPAQQQRALLSISVFALNRSRLVQARTNLLTILRYQAQEIRDELEADSADGGFSPEHLARALRRVAGLRRMHAPDQPFSAMVEAFIDDFAEELLSRVAAGG
jgi:hypothetical protein